VSVLAEVWTVSMRLLHRTHHAAVLWYRCLRKLRLCVLAAIFLHASNCCVCVCVCERPMINTSLFGGWRVGWLAALCLGLSCDCALRAVVDTSFEHSLIRTCTALRRNVWHFCRILHL
jgi:hypothetical protein